MSLLADEQLITLTLAAGATYGPVDVGGWDSDLITLNAAIGAAGALSISLQWLDAAGTTIASSPVLFTGTNADQRIARVRHQGPYVNYLISAGPGIAQVTIEHQNRPMPGDGPLFPGHSGDILYSTTDAVGAGATVGHNLWGTGGSQRIQGFHGPAFLTGFAAAGIAAYVRLVDNALGHYVGGTTLSAQNPLQTQALWIPPRPTNIEIFNPGGAQQIWTALVQGAP